jgi:hypothetical protein
MSIPHSRDYRFRDLYGSNLRQELVFHPKINIPVPRREYGLTRTFDAPLIHEAIRRLGFDTRLGRKQIITKIVVHPTQGTVTPQWRTMTQGWTREQIQTKSGHWIFKHGIYTDNQINAFYKSVMIPWHYCNIQDLPWITDDDMSSELRRQIFIAASPVGLSHRSGSRILYLDIDDHDKTDDSAHRARECLGVLVSIMGTAPVFIEKSRFNGGFHAAFLTDTPLYQKDLLGFTRSFNSLFSDVGYSIEARTENKCIRIPCCYDYIAGELGAGEGDEFIPYDKDEQYNAFARRVLEVCNRKEYVADFKAAQSKLKPVVEQVEQPEPVRDILKALKNRVIYVRKESRGHRKPGLTPAEIAAAYPIYRGERNRTLPILASRCIDAGLTSIDFESTVRLANQGSHDLGCMSSSEFSRHCSYVFDRIKSTHNHRAYTASDPFISSEGMLGSSLRKKINDPRFISLVLSRMGLVYPAVRERYRREIPIVISELLGRAIYEHHNGRSVIPGIHTSNDLCCGYQFPRNYLLMMKKHHGLTMNIVGFARFFLKSGLVFSLRCESYCSSPELSYCRQYGFGALLYGSEVSAACAWLGRLLSGLLGGPAGYEEEETCSLYLASFDRGTSGNHIPAGLSPP